jgi:hypothetical protein
MILTSQLFDTMDRCERRLAFERDHQPTSITPLGLLYAAVEGSLVASDPCEGAKWAIADVTQSRDVNAGDLSPISAVKHAEAMAEVIGLALREKFGQAKMPEPVAFHEHEWQSNLFECRGQLHRIILGSYLDDDSLRSFAHSWQTIGELAALERSLTLTVVIIGAQRGGRRHSPWSKGFLHPIQKTLRIGRRKAGQGDGFTTGWKEIWREQSDIKAETWLDRMKTDEMLGDLIVTRKIQYRGEDERMKAARREMLILADQMGSASVDAPMRRSSCDEIGRGACPWQPVCYSPVPVSPDDLPHLYRIREMRPEVPAGGTLAGHTFAHTP